MKWEDTPTYTPNTNKRTFLLIIFHPWPLWHHTVQVSFRSSKLPPPHHPHFLSIPFLFLSSQRLDFPSRLQWLMFTTSKRCYLNFFFLVRRVAAISQHLSNFFMKFLCFGNTFVQALLVHYKHYLLKIHLPGHHFSLNLLLIYICFHIFKEAILAVPRVKISFPIFKTVSALTKVSSGDL